MEIEVRSGTMSVLMVAEKPSLAQSLAQILSNGNLSTRKTNVPCPVHEYRGSFLNTSNVLFKFTSVCGHLFAADFEEKFRNWDKSEPIELYDAQIIRTEANPKMKLVKFLQKEVCFSFNFYFVYNFNLRLKDAGTWCCGLIVIKKERTFALK